MLKFLFCSFLVLATFSSACTSKAEATKCAQQCAERMGLNEARCILEGSDVGGWRALCFGRGDRAVAFSCVDECKVEPSLWLPLGEAPAEE